MKNMKKHTLLKGEGVNQHTLYGDFAVDFTSTEFNNLRVKKDSVLRHETPSGKFAEHQSLPVERGDWAMGRQVEYNPFSDRITNIWD
jgi:hypothetical protein